MKRLVFFTALLVSSGSAIATTKHIHIWRAGKTQNWHSAIVMTNTCHNDSVETTVKLWESTGNILNNTTLSSGYVTDGNGEIISTLEPHQTVTIQISGANFPSFKYGSGSISTNNELNGIECLVASHHGYYSANGTGQAYLLNNGNPF